MPSPTPSLVPACYDSGSGPLLLHWSLAGLPQPSGADCDELANSFPGAVSLIECAEQLRQWGAAPEQRLALYFRRLPSVSWLVADMRRGCSLGCSACIMRAPACGCPACCTQPEACGQHPVSRSLRLH